MFLQKQSVQEETGVLRYNVCPSCSKPCEYKVNQVVFFPHEVERGLHKMFPFKVMTIKSLEIHYFDDICPYFSDGLCELYGTENMPLDCQIYPIIPLSHKVYLLDEDCLLKRLFQKDKQFIKRCMEKIQGIPVDFLEIYKDL